MKYLNRLRSEGVRPADVVVLSPYRFERSVVNGDLGGLACNLQPLDRAEPDSFRFATVASFKGLESHVVVLVDFDAIEGARRSTELYVAMSRSRSLLAIFLPETERLAYDRLAAAMGARLVGELASPQATRPL